jgi:hypothetical protein
MRARATTVLLVVAAIALPAVMAVAVFYASDQAIGDTPGGVTPQFGASVQPVTTVPPATTETRHHGRTHRDSGGSTGGTTTAGTDDHGGSTSGRSPGGSGSSGGSGHGGGDGGGDS